MTALLKPFLSRQKNEMKTELMFKIWSEEGKVSNLYYDSLSLMQA